MSKKQKNKQQLYTDEYFEKGHWLLKIRQTLMSLIGWLAVIIPIVITVTSFWASFNPKVPHIWSYPEGILEIKFIGVILLFAFVMSGIFSISMTIIQNRKRQRLVQQWPTFNPINQKKRENTIDIFIDKRFGNKEFRENVRTYNVQPEQNLDTDEIHKLYDEHHINDLD
ncbi:hypothetical protein [Companilactobacillus kimchii]|uniref:Uncharacterized protein n=2 Tax=Companilactobacillus kimchii TaxID=2801452 RepID=A0ABR5NRD9_9LACO|nr:hypothetical protein [Companilactobacillus kimchii]GEO48016.1 hypothetical protein LKI01_20150 [Companilactobacillus paralimentarius]KAE9557267.1 hypothetical protein ATN91_03755 [Companilactobacillus kimchii]KAE9559208.1 hypothetical protein ATN91_11185 [Companilactobacillus kimchii]KRK50543.1 hypothetical protein FC97_GL001466 [Companilactobacillus kimchii DSM 13961 = JCM 10707]OWF33722.1 hypothetical protein LKACC12383_00862 [Companilactobacillus kimchii]